MDIKPIDCVIGRTYLLKTDRGWEEVITLGQVDQYNVEFILKNRGLFGTRLWAPKVLVQKGELPLRTKEKEYIRPSIS